MAKASKEFVGLKDVKWGREPGIFLCHREFKTNKQTKKNFCVLLSALA